MAERTLDLRSLELFAAFERYSGVQPVDLVETDERYVFVVPKEHVGKCVGKGGARLRTLRDHLGRIVDIVAYSEDPGELAANFFRPHNVQEVKIQQRKDGTRVARVKVAPKDKGRAIGKNGANVKLAGELLSRHSDVSQVVVDSGTVVTGA